MHDKRAPRAPRRRRPAARDVALEEAILSLLAQRGPSATICPSEAARAVCGEAFRSAMEPAREAARRLVARGEIEITQRGRVVEPSTARGPIRLRRKSSTGER